MTHIDALTTLNDQEAVRQFPLSVFLGLVGFVGLIGNLVVCYIYTHVYKNSNSRCFIRWLAAVDLITCIIAIPLEIYTVQNQYQFDEPEVCKASRFMNAIGTTTSATILVLIALDRYRKICHPLEWQISNERARILCFITFICGFVFSLPNAFIYGIKSNDVQIGNLTVTGTECSVADSLKGTKYALIYNTIATMIFILCAVTLVTLYTLLGRKVRFFAKKREERHSSSVVLDSFTSNAHSNVKRKLSELNGNLLNSVDKFVPCAKIDDSNALPSVKEHEDVFNDTQAKQNNIKRTETIEETAHSLTYDDLDGLSGEQPSYAVEDTVQIVTEEHIRNEEVTIHTTHHEMDSGDVATKETPNSSESSPSLEDQIECESVLNFDIGCECDENDATSEKVENIQTDIETMSLDITVATDSFNSLTAEEQEGNRVNIEVTKPETNVTSEPTPKIDPDPCSSKATVSAQESDSRPLYHADEMSTQIPVHRLSRINTIKSHVCRMVSFKKVHRVTVHPRKSTKTLAHNTTFLMFIITMVFLFTYLPYLILAISRELIDGFVDNMTDAGRTVFRFFLRMYFANAAVNPIIYSIFDRRFRIACKQTFKCIVNKLKCRE